MSLKATLIIAAASCLVASSWSADQVWDGGGGADQNWATALNWGGDNPDTLPASGDTASIMTGGTVEFTTSSGTQSVQVATIGGGSTLNMSGGKLTSSKTGNTTRNDVGSGSVGVVNQSGGTHIVAHMLRVGHGSGGDGTYALSDGDLLVTRGGLSGVASSSTSIDVGVNSGMGLFHISGGSLVTRVGVGIGAGGTFRMDGSNAGYINIGSNGSGDGHWEQDAGGILDLRFDLHGLTPIFVDHVDGSGSGGSVVFDNGSLLHVGMLGGLDTFGVWEVMHWEGALNNAGLAFDPVVNTNQWSFHFIDTTGSGDSDTLRIKSIVEKDGTWGNASSTNTSWADNSEWSGGVAAYGAGKTAYFDALNHLSGPQVDLPTDIVIGTIRYRDNGQVNRSMSIGSSNSSRLIMASSSGVPLIWARNKNITLDVVLDGSDGIAFAATQGSGNGVTIRKRNRYTGTTIIQDDNGLIKTTYPGDFGGSDLIVQGDANDAAVDLRIDHGGVLATSASMSVETGALVELDFIGAQTGVADFADLTVQRLTLGGVELSNGVYSASTHPSYFTGTGEVAVQPVRDPIQISFNETNALSWPSQTASLYDIYQAEALDSNAWVHTDTVMATVPTNTYPTAMTNQTAGFYRIVGHPDYLPTVRAGVVAELDRLIANHYLVDQNLNTATNRHGQFHNSDNMRMSECTPVLVWCYMQPDSQYYQDPEVLNRAIWSVDYMCRAQGINGGFNEYHGWCGVPNRTNGKSSVLGFTMHGIGNAVELMCNLPEMSARLDEYMDPNGTGLNDTERRVAWKTMLANAMVNQFSGSGRGHAPNQDLCALMGVYAINGAYAALDGGTLLKTQAEIDVLSNEIYYGYPSAAASNPNGQWFSATGMLGEHGHGDYGYDGNYGVKVCFRYLGVLAPHDATTATFLSTRFAEAMQYFFVVDEQAPLGVFAENGIARRSLGDPLDPTMSVLGCAAGYHPSLDRLYDIMLPKFAEAPSANFNFSSPHMFQIGVWGYCEWLDKLSEPVTTNYRLPTEKPEAFAFRDDTMKLLVTKPEGGEATYYTEIWDTADKARRHVTGRSAETIDSHYEF